MKKALMAAITVFFIVLPAYFAGTQGMAFAQGNGAYAAYGDLASLPLAKDFVRKRFSSFDRTGGNSDNLKFKPGETKVIAETRSPGCVRHIWCTIGIAGEDGRPEKGYLRKIVIRMFWDGAKTPSVEAPIGDFFGMGHGISRNFSSAPLQMSPDSGTGFNCWFPMPFAKGMRIEITNECKKGSKIYYYVDWEEYDRPPAGTLRFHASWHREITKGISDKGIEPAWSSRTRAPTRRGRTTTRSSRRPARATTWAAT